MTVGADHQPGMRLGIELLCQIEDLMAQGVTAEAIRDALAGMRGGAGLQGGEAPWLAIAHGELGIHETPGTRHTDRIVEYHSVTAAGAAPDEVAWCSSFVCWCLQKAGRRHTRSKSSLSYLRYGQELAGFRIGAIAVLSRGTNPNQGHVGFVVGWDDATLHILGGNQDNEVSIRRYPRARLKALRWPEAA